MSAGATALAAGCCRISEAAQTMPTPSNAMLRSRPGAPSAKPTRGLQPLGLGLGRDGFIYVPPTYVESKASPLLILLHGAGQTAQEWTRGSLAELLDPAAIVAIIPDSRFMTWDMIYDDYGIDVKFIDRALDLAFKQCRIDPARIAIGGFSDGATYALSLGITNANLTRTVLAFSPGFVKPAAKTGKPRIFISHGTRDPVLPIDATSREIVAALREKNYPLKYEEFDGGHQITPEIARHAIEYFLS